MKTTRSVVTCVLIAGLGLAGTAAAQCTLDGTVPGGNGPIAVSGNTCGKNATLGTICSSGNVTNGAGTSVIQLNLGGTPNFGLQVISTTTGFSPELAFTSGLCTSLSACTVDDTRTPLPQQTVPPAGTGTGYSDTNFDGPSPQPGAGTGFVFITDLNTESPGCGAYTLNIAGTLPVKLQDFSVQ